MAEQLREPKSSNVFLPFLHYGILLQIVKSLYFVWWNELFLIQSTSNLGCMYNMVEYTDPVKTSINLKRQILV